MPRDDGLSQLARSVLMTERNAPYAADAGPYATALNDADEQDYQRWMQHIRSVTGTDLDPDDPSYDMRGFWQSMRRGEVQEPTTPGGHFTDTFKTPAHPFFSRESKFALPTAPYWTATVPLRGGATDTLIDPLTGKPTAAMQEEIAAGYPENAVRDQLLQAGLAKLARTPRKKATR